MTTSAATANDQTVTGTDAAGNVSVAAQRVYKLRDLIPPALLTLTPADGAAAILMTQHSNSIPENRTYLQQTGSCVFPGGQEEMKWIIGDHGFEMTLSSKVPGMIIQSLRPWLESWLKTSRWSV